jgi:hypothetical protein
MGTSWARLVFAKYVEMINKRKNMKEEKKQVSEQEQTSFRELVNLCRDIEDLYGHELDD